MILPGTECRVGSPSAIQDHAGSMIDPALGTSRRLVEGACHKRLASPLSSSTTPLRVAVPLPVPGRIF